MTIDFKTIWEYQFQVKHIFYLIAAYLALVVVWNILCILVKGVQRLLLKRKARKYREERDKQVKAFVIPSTKHDKATIDQILNSDVVGLKKLLSSGKVTSEDLVNIFSQRVQEFGLEYCAITHLKYNEAIEEARACDRMRKQNSSNCQGLLYGIPISIKETFEESGYPSTIGCIERLDHVAKSDGAIVKLLKKAGAIPFLRTNVPQAAMTFESMNEIYGRVRNPWDPTKLAGGSSGGEGAAVSGRMSPLGLGSDIGGSIRIPAAMCGVYGFKPTSTRSIMSGHTYYSDMFNGQKSVPCCSGPIGKSVDDLVLMFKAFSDPKILAEFPRGELDPMLVQLPIDENALNDSRKKRRFGYYKSLKSIEATSCMQRGVEEVVQKLRAAGHELVEIEIPDEQEIMVSFLKVFFSDKLESITDVLKNEGFVKEYGMMELAAGMSKITKSILGFLLKACGQRRLAVTLQNSSELNSGEYKRVTYQISELQTKVLKLIDEQRIEAIICPAFGAPALSHSSSGDTVDLAFYTYIWNALNFPAGVVPITRVQENEQNYDIAQTRDIVTSTIDKYMKQSTAGLPVGVQIAASPLKEEVVLNVMKLISTQFQFHKTNPLPELKHL